MTSKELRQKEKEHDQIQKAMESIENELNKIAKLEAIGNSKTLNTGLTYIRKKVNSIQNNLIENNLLQFCLEHIFPIYIFHYLKI